MFGVRGDLARVDDVFVLLLVLVHLGGLAHDHGRVDVDGIGRVLYRRGCARTEHHLQSADVAPWSLFLRLCQGTNEFKWKISELFPQLLG